MLGHILIGVAAVLVVFLVVVATRSGAYFVERKVEVSAPADRVFGVLNDLHSFVGVFVLFREPFEQSDPDMQKTYEGPVAGVGQKFSWSGKKAGQGQMTIEESVPGRKVGIKLEFVKPMKSTAALVLTLAGTPTGTTVTWSMAGNHIFIGKVFRVFMNMDNMLAADIEKGLALLKTRVEAHGESRAS